ncbi:MAG: zinc-dependent metalloprotease, partial [Candidatus Eremiobacteraeota bacterium]|nr:zinc-dependent metalloprotease [Candidatus Eremiobacteraeota bacterium]
MLAPQVASGLGKGLYAGLHLRDVLWKFHRNEDQIQSIEANPYAKVQPGAPAAAAVADAFPESVISSDPIMAVNPDNGHIVFGADALFTDIGYLSDVISYLIGPPFTRGYSLNRGLSYWGPTKAFPKNVDVEIDLTLNGQGSLDTVPDPRSLFVRLHYSILDLPHGGYKPRLADDRVGYFITARRQFDDLADPGSFVRYIERWDIRKSDPAAHVSPAKKPVVYYLSNDIPERYRPAIRGALLTWNKAFEAIGIRHAIEVRQQPKDPNWDPDDVRYSVVRWIVSAEPLFVSAAPVFVNPLNGEIIRADLVIDGSAIRSGRLVQDEIVDPTRALNPQQAVSCWQHDCDYAFQMAQQQQWADLVLADEGVLASGGRPPDWFVEQYLRAVVLHESGHTLGLRHNFQASGLYHLGQLHDRRFTAVHGLGASVMDYLPVNVSPHGRPQADYYQTMLGPWDYFAIRYGYQPVAAAGPQGERSALQRLASQATRRELAYATDEDNAWEDGFATDPRVNQFDLSDDPLAYAQQVLDIDQRLFATLPQRLPRYGASYAQARRAFEILLSNWWSVSRIATHYIGGEYFTRNHRGDPNARLPFTPVPRGEQQRAFALLNRYVFGDGAFHFSPALINALGDDRFLHWGSNPNAFGRLDFPVDEWVQAYQLALLAQMWQPSVLGRLASLETRVQRPGDTMTLADLYD